MDYKKKIIYDSKKRIVYDNSNNLRKKYLSENEGRLLVLLGSGGIYNFEDINRFLYGKNTIVADFIKEEMISCSYRDIQKNEEITNNQIRMLIQRVKKKILNFKELTIKNRNGIGYYLKGDLYIE